MICGTLQNEILPLLSEDRKQRWLLIYASLLVDGNMSTVAAGGSLML